MKSYVNIYRGILPSKFGDQPVGDLGVLHRIKFEPLGFVHAYPSNQNGKSGNHTETKREMQDSPEAVGAEDAIHR